MRVNVREEKLRSILAAKAEQNAKVEAERKVKEVAERKAKEETEQLAKEEAEWKAKEEAGQTSKEEADQQHGAGSVQDGDLRRDDGLVERESPMDPAGDDEGSSGGEDLEEVAQGVRRHQALREAFCR